MIVSLSTFSCWIVNESVNVAKEEFGPRELLRKYEWFKDASAEIDKKLADIKVYESRLQSMRDDYEDVKRKDWDWIDKDQFNLWTQEVAGVKASYNSLVAEYNAQMVKFNWRFCNKGTLPKGATEPLPREFKSYQCSDIFRIPTKCILDLSLF